MSGWDRHRTRQAAISLASTSAPYRVGRGKRDESGLPGSPDHGLGRRCERHPGPGLRRKRLGHLGREPHPADRVAAASVLTQIGFYPANGQSQVPTTNVPIFVTFSQDMDVTTLPPNESPWRGEKSAIPRHGATGNRPRCAGDNGQRGFQAEHDRGRDHRLIAGARRQSCRRRHRPHRVGRAKRDDSGVPGRPRSREMLPATKHWRFSIFSPWTKRTSLVRVGAWVATTSLPDAALGSANWRRMGECRVA